MKIIISILSLFSFISLQAQMTILDSEDNIIVDGDEFTFQSIEEDIAKFHFYIKNEFNNAIQVKAKMIEITGTDGSNVQFCMGECLFNVSEGTEVPENEGFTVEPNSTTSGPGTYFWNLDNTASPISYTFRIYQTDALGNEAGNPINITYTYNSDLAVDGNELSQVKLYPTLSSDVININLNEEANADIFNLQGQLVASKKLASGNSQLNISNFSSGVYLIKFQGKNNTVTTKKFIKK